MLEAHQTEIILMAWVLVVAIATRLVSGRRDKRDPLEDLLKKRYINGEITEEECKRKESLLDTGELPEKENCESFTEKRDTKH
jgi:hypothetical protein